ncbi:hypothetical protein BIW11_10008 [Tropilaelaps mercedesae]|uniref:Uncharacterized protein n=1 Tax=Tropilaelaps mercedesae TaxID=418985 RepID=A0A1V9XHK6_9ACAR|nr:hypothetical protein BIW11_10008 [Tropilaelaps mercedesae]
MGRSTHRAGSSPRTVFTSETVRIQWPDEEEILIKYQHQHLILSPSEPSAFRVFSTERRNLNHWGCPMPFITPTSAYEDRIAARARPLGYYE